MTPAYTNTNRPGTAQLSANILSPVSQRISSFMANHSTTGKAE